MEKGGSIGGHANAATFREATVDRIIDVMASANDGKERGVPTVSRVCEDGTLVEMVYDPVKRKTALAVSRFGGLWNIEQEVRVETGETLIPYAATNNLIRNACILLPEIADEYWSRTELVTDIAAFLHRYVDLSPAFEEIAAYYILLSWVHDRFNELPYLRLQGEFGTGKTRALIAIGSLAYRGFFASGASTVSPIFHVLDSFGGTLVLDESDLPYSDAKADLVKVFNNGTVRGMPVLRCVPNRFKEYNPQAFKVFGPKIVAMRGAFQDEALESRFITEVTGVRPLRSDIPIQLLDSLKSEALALRNRLLHFRFCEFWKIHSDPDTLAGAGDARLNQMAVSLLSVVDDPDARSRIRKELLSGFERRADAARERPEVHMLAAALAAFKAQPDGSGVAVDEIARRFNDEHADDYGAAMSNRWIGSVLRTRLHVSTRKTNGIYQVPRSERPKLDTLAQRYGLRSHETNT